MVRGARVSVGERHVSALAPTLSFDNFCATKHWLVDHMIDLPVYRIEKMGETIK